MPATCVPSVLSVTGWVLASRTVSLHVGARTSGRCQSTRRRIYTPVAPPRQREAPARPPRARRARAGGARGARGRECSFLESDINSLGHAGGRLILPPLKTPTRRKRGMPPHRHDGDPCRSPDVHSHRLLGRVGPGSEGDSPAGRPPMSHWRRHDTYVTSAAAWRRVPVEAQVVLARVGVGVSR